MIRNIFLFVSIIISVFSQAQQPIYKCEFADSIRLIDYNSVVASIRNSLIEKGVSPEMVDKDVQKYFGDPSSLAIVQKIAVNVYFDSSIITLNYDSHSNNRTVLGLPGDKLKVESGQLFRYIQALESYTLLKIPDSSQLFISTGKQKEILNFICEEYISSDLIYKIWVTDKLPSTLNPGIGIKNINKAILAFEAKTGNTFTKVILKKIEKM